LPRWLFQKPSDPRFPDRALRTHPVLSKRN
jgi:hypothetical protein